MKKEPSGSGDKGVNVSVGVDENMRDRSELGNFCRVGRLVTNRTPPTLRSIRSRELGAPEGEEVDWLEEEEDDDAGAWGSVAILVFEVMLGNHMWSRRTDQFPKTHIWGTAEICNILGKNPFYLMDLTKKPRLKNLCSNFRISDVYPRPSSSRMFSRNRRKNG